MAVSEVDRWDQLLTAVEMRLPYGNRLVQVALIAVFFALLAYCVGMVAPVVDSAIQRLSGATPAISFTTPTVSQWIGLVVISAVIALASWRLMRTVQHLRVLVDTAQRESREQAAEADRLSAQLDEQNRRAKREGERLESLLVEALPPHTFATTAPAADPKEGPAHIPQDEFSVEGKARNGGLVIKVGNPYKPDPKTDFNIRIMDVHWHSATLEGKGGFVAFDTFHQIGGKGKSLASRVAAKRLPHGDSHYFELLKAPDREEWRFQVGGQAIPLNRSARWRFFLELVWQGKVRPLLAEIELQGINANMAFFEGDAVEHRIASESAASDAG